MENPKKKLFKEKVLCLANLYFQKRHCVAIALEDGDIEIRDFCFYDGRGGEEEKQGSSEKRWKAYHEHSNKRCELVPSRDNKYLLSCFEWKEIVKWDLETLQPLWTISEPLSSVSYFTEFSDFFDDGRTTKWLSVVYNKGIATNCNKIYDLESGSLFTATNYDKYSSSVVSSLVGFQKKNKKGYRYAVAFSQGLIEFFDGYGQSRDRLVTHDHVTSLLLSDDETFLFVGTLKYIRCYHLSSSDSYPFALDVFPFFRCNNVENFSVRVHAVSPDQRFVLCSGGDNNLYLRDFASGQIKKKYDVAVKKNFKSAIFSPDGSQILTCCDRDVFVSTWRVYGPWEDRVNSLFSAALFSLFSSSSLQQQKSAASFSFFTTSNTAPWETCEMMSDLLDELKPFYEIECAHSLYLYD